MATRGNPQWWSEMPPLGKALVTLLAFAATLFGLGVGWTVKAQVYSTLPYRVERLETDVRANRNDINLLLTQSQADSTWRKRTGCLIEAMALKQDPIGRCGL